MSSPNRESRLGRFLHRSFFKALSVLPRKLRIRIQQTSFDVIFKASKDPWQYQDSEYEAGKRRALIDSLPSHFQSLVEIGCADGHNLAEIRSGFASPVLVGIDISAEAIRRAEQREIANTTFVLGMPGISQSLHEKYGTFDVFIFSEMLYYIGNLAAWRELMTPLKVLLHPGTIVIAVHPSSDATLLHDRLCEMLGLKVLNVRQYPDVTRPFEIRIATLPER